jgi:hypothetical protein
MLGRETNQPADLMFGEGQEKIYSGNDEYVMGLENAIKNAHEVARSYPQNILLHPSSFYSACPPDHWRMVYKASYELKKGNEYVLMMVDQFTKWTECIPLPSQTDEITAQAAINEFFARFG